MRIPIPGPVLTLTEVLQARQVNHSTARRVTLSLFDMANFIQARPRVAPNPDTLAPGQVFADVLGLDWYESREMPRGWFELSE